MRGCEPTRGNTNCQYPPPPPPPPPFWAGRAPTTRLAAWKHGLEVVAFKQEDDVATGRVARVVGELVIHHQS